MPITEKLKTYIQSGNGMVMGTRDASMKPEFQRVLGARVVDDNHIRIFFDNKTAGRIFQNLEDNQMVTVVMCSATFESYQFKGKSIRWAECTEEELNIMEEYFKDFSESMKEYGLGEDFVYKYPHTQMMTLLMEVTDIFEQTPKIGTGQKV
jgi:predicted pyridoxine 5'-phosphate oxidase superfamily flavin-nucleotide-binding protein